MGIFKNTTLISFATPSHFKYQKFLHDTYGRHFKSDISYTSDWIKTTEFYKENIELFKYKKYFGYFLWKPYIINLTLNTMDSDYLLYCDSNIELNNIEKLEILFEEYINKDGIFIPICHQFINKDWTKRDTFILMNSDNERYYNCPQPYTSILGFSKITTNMKLIKEYLHYCKDERIVTELPNILGENLSEFKEHRWEQSVLAILLEKYKLKSIPYEDVSKYIPKNYIGLEEFKKEINSKPLEKEEICQ